MASVELNNVEKVYSNGSKAVDGVSLHIRHREFVVLVGPSGCGKSTTLRMIAGLEDVTGGTIKIGDKVVNHLPPRDRDIAMVFQSYALYPHKTVYENLGFALSLRKLEKSAIDEKIREAARMLEIEHLLQRKPGQLSGGQRQRVALGRALVRNPRCFLFDEPLSNLDAKLRVQMRAEIKRLHLSQNATTVYVTHDQEEAMTLGDRVVVMKDGVVQQLGRALEVYDYPTNKFVASFLGSPPMNFISGRLVEQGPRMLFDADGLILPLPDRLAAKLRRVRCPWVVLGIRPEGLSSQASARFPTQDNCFNARVDLVQPLGRSVHVHLSTDKLPHLVADVIAPFTALPGEEIPVFYDPNQLHFFSDDERGVSLLSREPSLN